MQEIELERIDITALEKMRNGRNAAQTLADNSLATYAIAARQFNEFLLSRRMKVNEDSLKSFFAANQHWCPTTHNLKRQAIMKLIQYQTGIDYSYLKIASVRELFKKHIARAKNISQAVRDGKYLTELQVKTLLKKASRRISLMMEFAFVTGCRVSELIHIQRHNVRLGEICTIKLLGKGSKQREVFASRELIDEIVQVFDGAIFLFETLDHEQFDRKYVWREMKLVGERCKIKVYPHIFRHSCGMHLHKKKRSPKYVQNYLGHSSVATTLEFYFHDEPNRDIVRLFDVR